MTSLRHNPSVEAERPAADVYLDAARECILDVGWRRTTLTEVARRSGVSRMTIYRTWPDMRTLLADLLTREWAALVARTLAAEPATGDQAHRLAHAVVATVRALRTNELLMRIVELDPDLLLPYLLTRTGRSQDAIIAGFTERIAADQRAGTIRAGDPGTLARTLVLAAHGFVLSAGTMAADEAGVDELDDTFLELLEQGLRP